LSEPGANLARVLEAWGEASRSRSTSPLLGLLAEGVVWQGLLPELVCHGRDEVSQWLGAARDGRLPGVVRMEAEEVGSKVVVTVEGPDLGPASVVLGREPAGAPEGPGPGARTLVLAFEEGKVVRMESYATRQEALARAT